MEISIYWLMLAFMAGCFFSAWLAKMYFKVKIPALIEEAQLKCIRKSVYSNAQDGLICAASNEDAYKAIKNAFKPFEQDISPSVFRSIQSDLLTWWKNNNDINFINEYGTPPYPKA